MSLVGALGFSERKAFARRGRQLEQITIVWGTCEAGVQHAADCGHTAIEHDGHIDYLHDGHLHSPSRRQGSLRAGAPEEVSMA